MGTNSEQNKSQQVQRNATRQHGHAHPPIYPAPNQIVKSAYLTSWYLRLNVKSNTPPSDCPFLDWPRENAPQVVDSVRLSFLHLSIGRTCQGSQWHTLQPFAALAVRTSLELFDAAFPEVGTGCFGKCQQGSRLTRRRGTVSIFKTVVKCIYVGFT